MNHLSIPSLATAFTVISLFLGTPSLAVLLLYLIHVVHDHMRVPPGTTDFGKNPDAILLMLKGITGVLGALARSAGWLADVLLNGLAIAALGTLVLSVFLWLTGRGLHANAPWARVSASLLLLLGLMLSLMLAISLHNFPRVLMLLLVIACGLGLHTLWAGHTPQTN